MVDHSFKPSLQCQVAVNRARGVLFQIKRSFAALTPDIFRPLYITLVRPILEYGVQAMSPYLARDVELIEKFQHLATRMVKGFGAINQRGIPRVPYEERLRRLRLFSMSRRRLRGDLILAFSIRNGVVDLPFNDLFFPSLAENRRGFPFNLLLPRRRILRRTNAFFVRLPSSWNRLPLNVRQAPSLSAFKKALDKCWASVFPQHRI